MKHPASVKQEILAAIAAALLLVAAGLSRPALAATPVTGPLNLASSPLFLMNSVTPNVLLTFDDSGSMSWMYLPDDVVNDFDQPQGCANNVNGVYYNPLINYAPAVDYNGNSLGNANFLAAWNDGYHQSTSTTVNLSNNYVIVWQPYYLSNNWPSYVNWAYATCGTQSNWYWTYHPSAPWYWPYGFPLPSSIPGFAQNGYFNNDAPVGQPAFYYVYDPSGTGCAASQNNNACYTKYVVGVNAPPPGNPQNTTTATDEQNFANWYAYYRERTMTAKNAIGRAFAQMAPDSIRVAGQHLNNTSAGSGSSIMFTTTIGLMRSFSGTARQNFFTRVYNAPANGGTPTEAAFKRAGQYFSTSGVSSPYATIPGTEDIAPNASSEYSCRQNFNVLITDGQWNDGPGNNNTDSTTATLGDNTTSYTPQPPYEDSNVGFLSDYAFKYWETDLRPDLTNNVPPYMPVNTGNTTADYWNPQNDPATWQHMVDFTIGLGNQGLLAYNASTLAGLEAGTVQWPCDPTNTSAGCPGISANDPYYMDRIDDLWHTAIDSRGQYFSARDPTQVANAFSAILSSIAARVSSAAAVALNAGNITSNSVLYQAKFNSADWSGQLLAYSINPTTGAVAATASWDAGQVLNTQDFNTGRQIISYNPATLAGIPFRWNALSPTESADLNTNPATGANDGNGQLRLHYLRGDASNEGTLFRVRTRSCTGCNTGTLGDIIDSSPQYVAAPDFGYSDPTYLTFYNAYKNRTPMVYVGANDGMLHGFDALTGQELLAYVPGSVYYDLNALTNPAYTHHYYVDGTPTIGDAYITDANTGGSPNWRTILVGGLRQGGEGYYALDVTDPSQFSEANAAKLALWEFTNQDDPDLGYTFDRPSIVKMNNGQWAVIFGNGYNDTGSGHAVLYILFIQGGIGQPWVAGTNFIKIDTGVGSPTDPNGLSTPAVVDVDGNGTADYIYAGDLQGNMWKFDVTSSNPSQWGVAYTQGSTPAPLFSAGANQPITTQPQIGPGEDGNGGYMVYFGTGKYLEPSDNSQTGIPTQTFYGIWDNGAPVSAGTNNANLLQQVATDETGTVTNTTVHPAVTTTVTFRQVTNNPITWRTSSGNQPGTYLGWYINLPDAGEQLITDPQLRDGNLIFETHIASNDPCVPGGTGWLMEVSGENGGTLPSTPFDLNGDGTVNSGDQVTLSNGTTVPAAGMQISGGGLAPPTITGGAPNAQGQCQEWKYVPQGNGGVQTVPESCKGSKQRQSWQELE